MKRTIATAKPLCEALGLEMQQRSGHRNQNENPGDDAVKVTRDSRLTEIVWLFGAYHSILSVLRNHKKGVCAFAV